MPNIRILAKAVLQIFCSQGCSYTKCLCPKKGKNSTENLRNRFKSQFIYILVCKHMPNIRILALAVLQIFCSQGCSYTKCLCPKKGNNSTKNLRRKKKNTGPLVFHVHAIYEISRILFTRLFLYNMPMSEKGLTQRKIYGIGSKVNQFIYIFVCNHMPNIGILALAVLQIFCSQGLVHNSRMTRL